MVSQKRCADMVQMHADAAEAPAASLRPAASKDRRVDVYFSADVETDGPIPGPFSMLSLALVYAGRFDGKQFERPSRFDKTFYRELRPISEEFQPEALKVNGLDRVRLLREGYCGVARAIKAGRGVRDGRLDSPNATAEVPRFSGDGEHLAHYAAQELIGKLGTAEDDVLNTFTARLLLLLESKSLLGPRVHAEVIRAAIEAYWRDYDGHESDFAPGFLANDIIRLWRTFCVNYEARTQSEPAEKKAKRKLKNYKLKHSRLLTCYSALLYLLAVFTVKGTVSQESAVEMSALTPTERLERLPTLVETATPQNVGRIIGCYEKFLRETDAPDSELLVRFQDPERIRTYAIDARAMGDAVHELLRDVGNDSHFYRMLVV